MSDFNIPKIPKIEFPKIDIPKIKVPNMSIMPRVDLPSVNLPKDHTMADTFYDRIKAHIEETEKNLKKEEQLRLLYFGQGGVSLIVKDIGYHNPNLIALYCVDGQGSESSVLVHMHSVQLIVQVIKIKKPQKKIPIGFVNN